MDFFFIGILGLIMGIVSSISGGSGVFAVPTMLAFGWPPINVLALNRMSDVGVIIGAIQKYHRHKNIDWRLALLLMVPLGVGSFLGAKWIVTLPEKIVHYVILIGVFIGIFFLIKTPKPNTHQKGKPIGLALMLLVGIWNGALAMAGATFAVLVMVYFFGKTFLEGRATDIVAAIPETVIAATILVMAASVNPGLLFTMFASSVIGAWVGSHLAVKHGDGFIRKAMIGIALIMVIKVVVDLL